MNTANLIMKFVYLIVWLIGFIGLISYSMGFWHPAQGLINLIALGAFMLASLAMELSYKVE